MGTTYGDHLIDIGANDIAPEQEREIEAREECACRGLDPDDYAADGVAVWMAVDQARVLAKSEAVNRLVGAGYLREDAEDIATEQWPNAEAVIKAAHS